MHLCPIVFWGIFTNSAEPDVLKHYAAFHLGLHSLQKCMFAGIYNKNDPIVKRNKERCVDG